MLPREKGSGYEFGSDNLYTCKLAEGSMKKRTTQCFSTLPSLDNLSSVLVSSNTDSLSEPEIKTTNTLPILVFARDGRHP